jgi:hypothetical protein
MAGYMISFASDAKNLGIRPFNKNNLFIITQPDYTLIFDIVFGHSTWQFGHYVYPCQRFSTGNSNT